MKNLSLSIVVAIFLHGCLYNNMDSLNNFYQKDIKSKKQLIKTQKAILYDGNKTKAILVATYSNDFDDINSSDERFVVSFYADDTSLDGYILKLNNKPPLYIKSVNSGDSLLSHISFKNDWKEYYLVVFPHTNDNKLYLTLENKIDKQKVKLFLSKRVKYR